MTNEYQKEDLPEVYEQQSKFAAWFLSELTVPAKLRQIALNSDNPDEFIWKIQQDSNANGDLMKELYKWEHSTPENTERFKHAGWFGIANVFWSEQQK
jgi:hypothetical protein